jgi:hypothetical protein
MAGEKIKKLEEEIGALETQYGGRTFSYDPDSDKGYQDYLKLMQDSGKKAMEDTVGKASALTGGYGNSYAATAGQQVYNDYIKQGAEAQASFRQLARDEFDAENQDILNRLGMLKEQKSSIWEDAARKAGFGDYSGYVDDLGFTQEQVDATKGKAAPTEDHIAHAREAFLSGGMEGLLKYTKDLNGFVDTDALIQIIDADTGIQNSKEGLKQRFEVTNYGGANWLGVNNNAELTLDGKTKTAKEWYDILTDENGDYKLSKEDAKEILKALGVHA